MNTRRIPNIHPGTVLREDFLNSCLYNSTTLALALKISHSRMERILAGKSSITLKIARGLATLFTPTAAFWIGLQRDFDEMEIK